MFARKTRVFEITRLCVAGLMRSNQQVKLIMSRRLHERIGQLIIAGYDGLVVPAEFWCIARDFELGGVILFARNIEEPLQIAEQAYAAKQFKQELPMWVSIDQEGGRVQRLRTPHTEWPPLATLGRCGDEQLAVKFAEALALELKITGITLDFAPVLDVGTNPANPVIGDRAIGKNAKDVANLGRAIVSAIQQAGVAACGKHFPGHGETSSDSHLCLPVVDLDEARLREVEIKPFCAAIAADVSALMTAHVSYPALDDRWPATLSSVIIGTLLRDELCFDGLIITDDMEMGAIVQNYDPVEASVRAVAAGCDVLLLCGSDHSLHVSIIEGIIHAVEDGSLSEKRVEDALSRQRRMKEKFLSEDLLWRPPSASELNEVIGCSDHQEIAETMRRYL
jgi:beta-N-acetylhexosaminidase